MSDGQTDASPYSGGGTSGIVPNTDVQDARCNGYDIPYSKSGASARDAPCREDSRRDASSDSSAGSASARYNIQRSSELARASISRLERAAHDEDFMEAASAGGALTDAIGQLWKFSSYRESEFAEIINMLQIALAKVHFEELSQEQFVALGTLLDECVLAGAADESDVRRARELLRQGGFDPWRGLSLREEK